jgi:hypothetical protein
MIRAAIDHVRKKPTHGHARHDSLTLATNNYGYSTCIAIAEEYWIWMEYGVSQFLI